MKELNGLNAFYILILLVMTGSIVAQHFDWEFESKYYYDVVATTPQTNPVNLQRSSMRLPYGRWIDISYSLSDKWGVVESAGTSEKKSLPVTLDLQYEAYGDQRFYHDIIPLPSRKLERIFKNFLKKDDSYSFSGDKNIEQELDFVIGIANH